MKAKKEYFVLAAVILALGLYLILRNPDRAQYTLPELADIDLAKISKIEIVKKNSTVVLDKQGDRWSLAPKGYPADPEKVKTMLGTVQTLAVTAMVSESKSYERYDLDDNKKIAVRVWAGDKLMREFELGKAAESFRHTFVKLAGDDRVYHARDNFRGNFDQTMEHLRDKTVLSFDQAGIEEIQITKGRQELMLARVQVPVESSGSEEKAKPEPGEQARLQTIWQTSDGKKANEDQLNRMIGTLSKLRCDKYVDDKNKEDFTRPIYAIHLKGAQEHTLSIFDKMDEKAKNYPAVSSGNDYPFFLSESQAENLMKIPEELLKAPDPS